MAGGSGLFSSYGKPRSDVNELAFVVVVTGVPPGGGGELSSESFALWRRWRRWVPLSFRRRRRGSHSCVRAPGEKSFVCTLGLGIGESPS